MAPEAAMNFDAIRRHHGARLAMRSAYQARVGVTPNRGGCAVPALLWRMVGTGTWTRAVTACVPHPERGGGFVQSPAYAHGV